MLGRDPCCCSKYFTWRNRKERNIKENGLRTAKSRPSSRSFFNSSLLFLSTRAGQRKYWKTGQKTGVSKGARARVCASFQGHVSNGTEKGMQTWLGRLKLRGSGAIWRRDSVETKRGTESTQRDAPMQAAQALNILKPSRKFWGSNALRFRTRVCKSCGAAVWRRWRKSLHEISPIKA
jgi:hypothetical protein